MFFYDGRKQVFMTAGKKIAHGEVHNAWGKKSACVCCLAPLWCNWGHKRLGVARNLLEVLRHFLIFLRNFQHPPGRLPVARKNTDILNNVANTYKSSFVVGFAAETSDVANNAKKKLKTKNLDMIISNDVSDKSIGFDVDENEVNVITLNETIFLKRDKKIRIAREILKIIANNTNK